MRDLAFIGIMPALLLAAAARPFVGVILWSWISFMNPHQLVWQSDVTGMPWALLVVCATAIGCVAALEPRKLPVNATTILIVAFVGCISMTSIFAYAPADLVEAKWEIVTKTFFFLLIAASLLTDRFRIHALIWIMVISLGYFGVRGGVFAVLTGGSYRVFGPQGTIISDNNQLAVALLVMLPLMNYLRLRSAHRSVRNALLVSMALTLFAVLGSYSRGALIGVMAIGAFFWLKSSRKLVSGALIVVCVVAGISFMPDKWSSRMSTIDTYQQDTSASDRLVMWGEALTMAIDRPFTGSGFMGPYLHNVVEQFVPGGQNRAVHSIYFEVIGEHGFLTFFVWLGLTIVGIRDTIYIRRLTRDVAALEWAWDLATMAQVSIVAYLVAGAFLSLSYWDFYFMLLVALAATRSLVVEALPQAARARSWRLAPIPAAGLPASGPVAGLPASVAMAGLPASGPVAGRPGAQTASASRLLQALDGTPAVKRWSSA